MSLLVSKLFFSFGSCPVIQNLNLNVLPGETTLIRGSSGSGKSTFLKLCAGLLLPLKGTIELNGVKIPDELEKRRDLRRQHIRYLDQESSLVNDWSVGENLHLVSPDEQLQAEALETVGLSHKINQMAGSLSGGEKQRVGLVRVLLQAGEVILLDEPTSHLDDRSTDQVMQLLLKCLSHLTVLIVSHDRRLENWISRVIDWKPGVE